MMLTRRRATTKGTAAEPGARLALARSLAFGAGSVGLTVVLILVIIAGTMLAVFGPAAPLVTVPDVAGMPQQDAEDRLKAARLTMKVANQEFSTDVKEGSIIAMSPYAGKLVRAGREVRVTVSRGGRVAKVPKLVGLTMAEAKERLADQDLQVGEEERRRSDEPADIILEQDPPAGKTLPRKSGVKLVVSGGKTFDEYKIGDHRFLFRTVKITVPQGKALQLVQVDVTGDEDKSFYERLCRPGEVVKVDLYGAAGSRVRVRIEDETVFSTEL